MAWNHILDNWAQAIDRMQPGHAHACYSAQQDKETRASASSMPVQSASTTGGVLDGSDAYATGTSGQDIRGESPLAITNLAKPPEM